MNPKHWNLLLANNVESLSPPDQFAAYAMVYLDSAERLCSLLTRSYRKATYERGTVVLYLAMHATELFLKGAILRKAPNERFGHDLEHMFNRYKALYPGKRYQLDIPFKNNYAGMSKSEIKKAKELSPPIDQRYRYPQDKDGKPWSGIYSFEANSFLGELGALHSSFNRLLKTYEG